jgi:hypothetical protein
MEFDTNVTQLGLATLAKLAGVLPPSRGAVFLDKMAYQPTNTVNIKLYDTDLNANPQNSDFALVEMRSTIEPGPETVILWETGINSSIFSGTIDLSLEDPIIDGKLQILEEDTLLADYQDSAPLATITASAKVDGIPPVISNVKAISGVSTATITWDTDELSDSKVLFGISPALGSEVSDSEMVTSHSIEIVGLEPSLTYYFDVQSTDYAGNIALDNNLGEHYNFTTLLGITGLGKSGYIGYVKESDPSGNYFTGSDILVGHGAQGNYHGAAQFRNLWFPSSATITNATVEFFGKKWIYTGSGGNWDLQMLDSAIDTDWQNHGYTQIRNAVVEDTITPSMNDGNLESRLWNTFYYDPLQYPTLESHLANSKISYRLDGPPSGYHLFVWETGNGDESWGEVFAPRITVSYDPIGDTQGPICSNLTLSPNPTAGITQVTLSGLLSDGTSDGSNIIQAKYYDPVLNSWVGMFAEDGLFNSPTENILGYIDISSWADGNYTIWVRGMDESGNWGGLVSIVMNKKPTFDIPLNFGWNLISLPLNQSNTSLSSIFSSINGFYDTVQWFDITDSNDPWKHNHNQKSPLLNDLNDLDHRIGIWIHIIVPKGVLFECYGTPFSANVQITLKPGWNHVGYPSLINKSRTDGLNNLVFGPDVDAIWTYSAEYKLWKEIGEFNEFEAGRGYWIHSNVDITWYVAN